MADAINDAELGRSKKSASPADHLAHLLGLGWDPQSPLIQKYVLKNRLQAQLDTWEALVVKADKNLKPQKLKNRKASNP